MKRNARTYSAIGITIGALAFAAVLAPSGIVVANPGFEIRSELNNKCLEILTLSGENGAPVGMWDCAGTANQRWYWDGRLLRSDLNNKCLEILDWNRANGAVVSVWDCHGGDNQRWYWDGRLLRSDLNNKCLEVVNSNAANRAPVGMWDCWGGAATRWYVP
ncbi:RICIN domain-containing protein [Sorangium sp. So ce363]|uniref:RICIN domain-containing protein n=1 Tax=Sorangium sp. So ce363 TaxID=3133304 RepID=UPI003F63992F